MTRDEMIELLDWPSVQDLFKKTGPMTITFSLKKTKSSSYIYLTHEKPKTKKSKK